MNASELSGMVLIIEDEPETLQDLAHQCQDRFANVQVQTACDKTAALRMLGEQRVNVVVTDMRMGSTRDGYELLLLIKKSRPSVQVIVHTAYDSVSDAVRCMRAGCFDYVPKTQVDSIERILESTHRALELSRVTSDRDSLRERLLLADWDEVRNTTKRGEKGLALESLCDLLFRSVPGWHRVESRVHSATEEIDLVVVNESAEVFWQRFGTVILVECKNWCTKKKPGRCDFDAFYSKVCRRGIADCRLGFFISLSGVTHTFDVEVGRLAKEKVRIVVIDEDGLWRMLCAEDRSEYLKNLVIQRIVR